MVCELEEERAMQGRSKADDTGDASAQPPRKKARHGSNNNRGVASIDPATGTSMSQLGSLPPTAEVRAALYALTSVNSLWERTLAFAWSREQSPFAAGALL